MPVSPFWFEGGKGTTLPDSPFTVFPPPRGLLIPGNIDLFKRPRIKNPDGTISTLRSISFNESGREVLIPTISDDGRVLSDEEAIQTYRKTGKHLGMFSSPENATAYARQVSAAQARRQWWSPN